VAIDSQFGGGIATTEARQVSYILDKLNDASDAIAEAMRDDSMRYSGVYMDLLENIVPELDRIRGKLMVTELDERRR